MEKTTCLITLLFFNIFYAIAQEYDFDGQVVSPAEFVVWAVEGTAAYTDDGSDSAQNLISGMTLKENGILELKKNAMVKLSWKDQILVLSKRGTYSLRNEAKKLADANPDLHVSDFMKAIGEASDFGEPGSGNANEGSVKKDTNEGSDQVLGKQIKAIMPIGGMVPLKTITFSWTGVNDVQAFRINIYQSSNQPPIFSALTENNSFTIDVAQLAIEKGEPYFWQVETTSTPETKSEMIQLIFTGKNEDLDVIRGLLSDREYSYAAPWLKLLQEAHALAKEQMLYSANEKYKQGLKEFGDISTVRKMYARFLTEQGLEALAREVME